MFDSVFNTGEVIDSDISIDSLDVSIDSDISAFSNDSLYIHTEENIHTEETIPIEINTCKINIIDKAHVPFNEKMYSISKQCEKYIDMMSGHWVIPKNAYEKDFCKLMGWKLNDGRYSDAHIDETFIEIKKGQGMMWFDMVRYAEIYMGKGRQETITIFIRYDKKQQYVRDIYIIDTRKIVEFLKMTPETSAFCNKIYTELPRGLNMQASATNKDMREMAEYIITSTREKEKLQKRQNNKEIGKKRDSTNMIFDECHNKRSKTQILN